MYVTIETVPVLKPMSHTTCSKIPIPLRIFLTELPQTDQKALNMVARKAFPEVLASSTLNPQRKSQFVKLLINKF